jgi:penicillin-binding protein 1A
MAILFLMVGGALAAGGMFLYFSMNLPKLKTLADYRPAMPTIMYDKDGNEAARFYTENREVVSIDQVPRVVLDAVISIEDSNYYEHQGLDYLGILRAFITNLKAGEIKQGGSTITQQVAKRLLLSNERKYSRKAKEAILARRITRTFTKDEILEIYLNEVYFGHGAYGIEAAAQVYFSRHVWELELPQVALLAGLPQAPSRYNPSRNPDSATERRNMVLVRMADENYITMEEKEKAIAEPLALDLKEADPNDPNAWFAEEVRRYLYDNYGEDALYRGGMKVHTTLDRELQELAVNAVKEGLVELDRRQGYRGAPESVTEESVAGFKEKLIEENGLVDYQYGVTPELPWEEGQAVKGLVFQVEKDGAHLELGGIPGYIPVSEMKWARKPNPKIRFGEVVIKDAPMCWPSGM